MTTKFQGQKFGTLTVLDAQTLQNPSGNWYQKFLVRCDCGNEYTRRKDFMTATAPTCKLCKKLENSKKALGGHKHPMFRRWWQMLARCYDPSNHNYFGYGARGIAVCDRWRGARLNNEIGTRDGFQLYVADLGLPPTPKHSVDRVNNDGNYSPDNCRWATQTEQANNTRRTAKVTAGGRTMTIAQWGREIGRVGWEMDVDRNEVTLEVALEAILAEKLVDS